MNRFKRYSKNHKIILLIKIIEDNINNKIKLQGKY